MNNIDHEEKVWSEIFENELKKTSNKKYSSYWWEDYYNDIINFIYKNVIEKFWYKINIIEVGSWSWKSSLLLWNHVKWITLLDISKNALKYAKLLSKKLQVNNVNYINWDIFNTKMNDEEFELTWNIWTLEHYSDDEIIKILQEMLRITKKWWYIAFWVPNEKSWPILKAKILKLSIFKFVPWYRLDTEKFFKEQEIFELLRKVGISKSDIKTVKFWSFLPMEMPKILIRITKNIFIKNKFLNFYLIKK